MYILVCFHISNIFTILIQLATTLKKKKKKNTKKIRVFFSFPIWGLYVQNKSDNL